MPTLPPVAMVAVVPRSKRCGCSRIAADATAPLGSTTIFRLGGQPAHRSDDRLLRDCDDVVDERLDVSPGKVADGRGAKAVGDGPARSVAGPPHAPARCVTLGEVCGQLRLDPDDRDTGLASVIALPTPATSPMVRSTISSGGHSRTAAPSDRVWSIFNGEAVSGMTTLAGRPAALAAKARACPWLPAE